MAQGKFLTARWENLINLTYRVPKELLLPHLPPGLELEEEQGQGLASLVMFDFLDTKVFGIPWPGYRNFPEWNLRFYVRYGKQRGVVFIREYVPKRIIATLAQAFYNEPYTAAPMSRALEHDDTGLNYSMELKLGGRAHTLRISATEPAWTPPADSRAHFFKEHEWGFGTTRKGKTLVYQVEHPVWAMYNVQSWALDIDFEMLYGKEWTFLADAKPIETLWAAGSKVAVRPKGDLSMLEKNG